MFPFKSIKKRRLKAWQASHPPHQRRGVFRFRENVGEGVDYLHHSRAMWAMPPMPRYPPPPPPGGGGGPHVPGQGAIENAVRRVMAGSGTKSLRKTSFAISTLPKMASTSGAFVLSHRECVGALTSAIAAGGAPIGGYLPVTIAGAAWPAGGLDIYPANATLFPWLSTIAARFEQYKWRKVNVQFITASGDGTTAALAQGNVMAYIEYNPITPAAPLTSQQFLNNFGAVATKPSQSFQMGVQAQGNPFELKWTEAGGDIRFSADGSLYMATEGLPVGQVFGYLYLDYTIELHKPQV